MADHIVASERLETAAVMVRDAIGRLAPNDIWRANRLRNIITQLLHEAAELRVSPTTGSIEGEKNEHHD